MNRREFLSQSTRATLGLGVATRAQGQAPEMEERAKAIDGWRAASEESALPGTAPLCMEGDLAEQMLDGIQKFLLRRTDEAARDREQLWKRDYRSVEQYEQSVAPNRERFGQIIGAVDRRVPAGPPEMVGSVRGPARVAQGPGYTVYAVRWAVLEPVLADHGGLEAEGLLLEPQRPVVARVVAIPDADSTPEMLVGLAAGVDPKAQFARRLAENGCLVVVPLIINRQDDFSGVPGLKIMTNQPHREWVYRMAYQVGRHIVGYEVLKVLAAVDWFESENGRERVPIGVIGYGEGGVVALYSAALDRRIDVTLVSGYFQEREELWKEPIYRNVWGLVREFGDAELASLIAPRALIVEASRGPEVAGPPPATTVHKEAACPNGKLVSPPLESVQKEVSRAHAFFARLKADDKLRLVVSEAGLGLPGSDEALREFLRRGGAKGGLRPAQSPPADARLNFDPSLRLRRQVDQLVGFTQALIRKSPERRKEFWAKANTPWPDENWRVNNAHFAPVEFASVSQWSASGEQWKEKSKPCRDYIWKEVIGRVPPPCLPPNPRSRQILDEPRYKGCEVVLDVWPEVFAYGILLVPKDIQPGERRPVVVCQHGLEGRPRDVADPNLESGSFAASAYHYFAVRLAEEGFVTYAPQNPYIGEDHFRIVQRMGHPAKLSLFSFVLGQHEQLLNWLAAQPFVDPDRIGFYGLSYGGCTAVRVPPLLERYALSICSANFNDWAWVTTNVVWPHTYMLRGEYDMCEFNFANVANYAELANLMAPRPFMVERGHYDGVAPDQEVAFEYAKVRWFYDYMGIANRTEIEFFGGPHSIHGVGTFEFLRRHLRWAERASKGGHHGASPELAETPAGSGARG